MFMDHIKPNYFQEKTHTVDETVAHSPSHRVGVSSVGVGVGVGGTDCGCPVNQAKMERKETPGIKVRERGMMRTGETLGDDGARE